MSAVDAPRPVDERREFLVIVSAAAALTTLAVVVPASALVSGPGMLLAGLLGIRRAKTGRQSGLILLAALGTALTLAALTVVLFLVAIR